MTIHNLDLILAASLLLAAIFIIAKNKMQYHPKKENPTDGKTKTYTCGEDVNPRELNTAQDTFYNTFIKTFKLSKLKKLHTGLLTDYLYWIFASLIIILTILVLIL